MIMPYKVHYKVKANPGNKNQPIRIINVPKHFCKLYGYSPLAALQYANNCFSHRNLDLLEVHDLSGCLNKLI